jgi:hypothetical protein
MVWKVWLILDLGSDLKKWIAIFMPMRHPEMLPIKTAGMDGHSAGLPFCMEGRAAHSDAFMHQNMAFEHRRKHKAGAGCKRPTVRARCYLHFLNLGNRVSGVMLQASEGGHFRWHDICLNCHYAWTVHKKHLISQKVTKVGQPTEQPFGLVLFFLAGII